MTTLNMDEMSDGLHRLAKLALDSGEVASIEQAMVLFSTYRLSVAAGGNIAQSAVHQAALLTIVNSGRRAMLGGVEVSGSLGAPLLLPIPNCSTVAEAVIALGGTIVAQPSASIPLVVVGDHPQEADRPFVVRATFEGWSGGVTPISTHARLPEEHGQIIAGVLSGAIAVAEAFQFLRRSNIAAGRRTVGLSLWLPENDWRDPASFGPAIDRLPSSLWLIGLGNLGQAYLWILSLMPYGDRSKVRLILQDFDILAKSNESTSMLTHGHLLGTKKTRAMAKTMDVLGFETDVVERKFGTNLLIGKDDPQVALCGVDNPQARTCLEDVGFQRVIEAGLGKGVSDYLAIRTHVFPGPRSARSIWGGIDSAEAVDLSAPAYDALKMAGADECGLTKLAGRTVGAPFVGTVAGCIVISEAMRLAIGAHNYQLIDLHLKAPEHKTVLKAEISSEPFNPGSERAQAAE